MVGYCESRARASLSVYVDLRRRGGDTVSLRCLPDLDRERVFLSRRLEELLVRDLDLLDLWRRRSFDVERVLKRRREGSRLDPWERPLEWRWLEDLREEGEYRGLGLRGLVLERWLEAERRSFHSLNMSSMFLSLESSCGS